jgi:hypothetical protein
MSVVIDVDRTNLSISRLNRSVAVDLQPGEVRLAVQSFALTSNNITYAVFGDGLKYWDFFPVGEEPWGRVPVWGFADVVESTIGDVAVGERVYGYLPMATELVVTPGRVDERGFTDMSEHRAPMAAAYNRYSKVVVDPMYRVDRESHQMVLWPLFMTSFMIDDYLGEKVLGDTSVTTVVLSSASSKTAIGAAFLLSRRPDLRIVGLTSSANEQFVQSLGCYHETVLYDAVENGSAVWPAGRAAYVDIAGNPSVTAGVHRIYEDDLVESTIVGGTHWDAPRESVSMPGPQPSFFFAPSQIAARTKEWGREGLDQRVGEAWHEFASWTDAWLEFRTTEGAESVEGLYHQMLAGHVDPRVGHVCRMS